MKRSKAKEWAKIYRKAVPYNTELARHLQHPPKKQKGFAWAMKVSKFSLLYRTIIATEAVEQTSEKATDDENANWGHLKYTSCPAGKVYMRSRHKEARMSAAHPSPNSRPTVQPAATMKLAAHSTEHKLLKPQKTTKEFVSFMPCSLSVK